MTRRPAASLNRLHEVVGSLPNMETPRVAIDGDELTSMQSRFTEAHELLEEYADVYSITTGWTAGA
jgi:hypothetical protein